MSSALGLAMIFPSGKGQQTLQKSGTTGATVILAFHTSYHDVSQLAAEMSVPNTMLRNTTDS